MAAVVVILGVALAGGLLTAMAVQYKEFVRDYDLDPPAERIMENEDGRDS